MKFIVWAILTCCAIKASEDVKNKDIEKYDTDLLSLSKNGRNNPLVTQVENLDVFGMFGFPLVFSRFIVKHYSLQKYDTRCQQSPILSQRMRALNVHAALLSLQTSTLTISPKPTTHMLSMLLKRKSQNCLLVVWGGVNDIVERGIFFTVS